MKRSKTERKTRKKPSRPSKKNLDEDGKNAQAKQSKEKVPQPK
jgi:hypothetical protein